MKHVLCSALIAAAAAMATLPLARAQGAAAPVAAPAAAAPAGSAEPDLAKGRRTYQRHCSVCHGLRAEGGLGPSLKGIGKRMSADDLTHQLMQPRESMPVMVPSPIGPGQLPDLLAYLLQLP